MLQLEHWPLDRFVEYARNPRHNNHAVPAIAAAIREFGFRVPILAKSDGLVVDGHLRLKAARQLGLETVPVALADDMTETQVKAFRLSVNKMAELADWDEDLLRLELQDLAALDFDLSLVGFDGEELARLLESVDPLDEMPALPDGDKAPFQQMTFTLHDTQAEQVAEALRAAKAMGDFTDSPNENSNGNALARICETFLTAHA